MSASASPGHHLFLGRDAELDQLSALMRGGTDTGSFVAVQGEGGIGKTTLIDAALALLPDDRQLLRGTADPMDRRRPFGLILDALSSVLGEDDRLIAAEQSEHVAGERLLTRIDSLLTRPMVLVLEDLHWADAATLRLLTRLVRTLGQVPLVIVGSLRVQARHEIAPGLDHLLSDLSERGLLTTMALNPLPESTCLAITERLIGGHADPTLVSYTASAGGNPLFLTELLRALVRDGAVTVGPQGHAVLHAPAGPSPSLAMVMMRHLSHLSAETRELLTTAALLGLRFSPAQLRLVIDRPMPELLPLLREAFAAGFIEDAGDDLIGFRHQLIQDVLLHDVPAAVRAELHRDIAARLDAADYPAATVAGHLLQATASPEDLAWMLRLADQTVAAAPSTAVELWQRVVSLSEAADPRHVIATAGLARSRLSAGHPAEAAALAFDALQYEPPGEVGFVLRGVEERSLLMQHEHRAAHRLADRYAASDVLSPGERAAHLAFSAWPLFMLGDLDKAFRAGRSGADRAREHGNHGAHVYALSILGLIANCRGDLDEAIAILTEAVDAADRHPSLAAVESFPHGLLAVALADVDRTAEAAALLLRGVEVSEQFGYRTGLLATHSLGAQARSHSGNLSDIAAELEAHGALLGSMDIRLDPPVRGLRTQVIAHQYGPSMAQDSAALLDPVPSRQEWGGRGRSWIWLGHSQPQRARGDDAATLEVLWRGWHEFQATEMLMDSAEIALDIVELARRIDPDGMSDATALAHEVVDVVTALAAKNPTVTHLQATSLAAAGVVSCDAEALVEAAELMASTPRRLDHARIAELAALALPITEGRAIAETSLQTYAEVGADHEVARARASFRRAGLLLRQQPRTRPSTGWAALTRTEERIAEHVATGETNLEIAQSLFVSRRTVETHVSNILAKLGLRSRTEIAIQFARRLDDARQDGE